MHFFETTSCFSFGFVSHPNLYFCVVYRVRRILRLKKHTISYIHRSTEPLHNASAFSHDCPFWILFASSSLGVRPLWDLALASRLRKLVPCLFDQEFWDVESVTLKSQCKYLINPQLV